MSNIPSINPEIKNQLVSQKSQTDLRQAAQQFESVLLMQLTSALNNSSDDGEDNLFGGDGGTGLAKQMFAEQMATTIANSGGIGLADIIVNQLGGKTAAQPEKKIDKFSNALAAVKSIKGDEANRVVNHSANELLNGKSKINLINKTAKFLPLENTANSGASNDFEVVSTAAEEIAKYGDADLPKPVLGDSSKFIFMRPRIVPQHMLDNAKALASDVNEARLDVAEPTTDVAAVEYKLPIADARVSSGYGNRFHPIDHKNKFHKGIDFAAVRGTPIAAAATGKVVFAGWQNGYGKTVVIEHPDGKQTRYGHAEKLFVAAGEAVASGQLIASVGSTGKSTGAHLHFEIIENNQHLNPLEILAKDSQAMRR